MTKEDSVQLRMGVRGKREVPKDRGTPKSRHGYGSPQRIKDRMKYLGECQALSLDDKFIMSVERFKEISQKVKKIFIGWSGGKDSTLVIDIAVASGVGNFEVVYADSGVEPIETTEYIKLFSELRGFKFKTLIAPTTFWQMTMTHGWPLLGGDRFSMGGNWQSNAKKARKDGDETRALAIERAKISGACSNVLKVVPMDRYAKYTGSDCTAMGLMAKETRQRMLVWLQKGDFYWHKSNKKWIFWPIATWDPKDVMAYFRSKNIPMCALYDPGRLDRNGCQACMKSWKWPNNNFVDTFKYHPEIWWEFMFKRGLCWKLWEIKKLYHVSQIQHYGFDVDASKSRVRSYAEQHPEFFWQL